MRFKQLSIGSWQMIGILLLQVLTDESVRNHIADRSRRWAGQTSFSPDSYERADLPMRTRAIDDAA